MFVFGPLVAPWHGLFCLHDHLGDVYGLPHHDMPLAASLQFLVQNGHSWHHHQFHHQHQHPNLLRLLLRPNTPHYSLHNHDLVRDLGRGLDSQTREKWAGQAISPKRRETLFDIKKASISL